MQWKLDMKFSGMVLLLHLFFEVCLSVSLNMQQLGTKETEAIDRLKELVKKRELQAPPYMTDDYYLARWLKFNDFDVDVTLQAFEKTMAWRDKERINMILKEDWSDMRQRFPYSRDTSDKNGTPIMYIDLGKWDVAGYLAIGQKAYDHFQRYMIMWAEEADAHVKKLRDDGKDVAQVVMLVNLVDFETSKHACLSCLQVYRDTSYNIGPNYPNWRDKIVVVGAPLIFRAIYSVLSAQSQNDMIIYGQDRNQWEPMLLETISSDQIPKDLLQYSEPFEKDNSEGRLTWKREL